MFKDTEILQNLQHTQVTLSSIGAVVNTLLQKIDDLQEQVNYLAAAEEARATHSKKPTRNTTNEFAKIIRINAFIQRKMGTLSLDGKEIVCVALDRTYATNEEAITKPLTPSQLDDLFNQVIAQTKEAPANG